MTKKEFSEKIMELLKSLIDVKKIKKYKVGVYGGKYIWNAFYYKLIDCFAGEEANRVFDEIDKKDAYEIQYDSGLLADFEAQPLSVNFQKSIDIVDSGLVEFYVFSKDFSWVYIVTHEEECGPYFCRFKKT